jgi:predicted nucleotidyltransferase
MSFKVNDTNLRILSLFTKGYNREYYIREVEKLLKVSSRTALVNLAKLEDKGILQSKTKGKIKTYSIKKSYLSMEYFILTEQYKKIRFLSKNHLIKEVLEKAENYLQGIVILFGSYAKGSQKDDSDIDLFIVGKYDEGKIKKIGKDYGIDINIKSYPMKIFKNKISNDTLLKEIVKSHIILKGVEGFIQRVIKWIK